MTTTQAMVMVADRRLELRELPLPEIGPDEGLLRVERCGICGSDVEQFEGTLLGGSKPGTPMRYPMIPGHEPLGVIEQVGGRAAERWGVQVGDRVIVEAVVACGRCPMCNVGRVHACRNRLNLGFITTDIEPSLWGGYARHLYLQAGSILHKVAPHVPLDVAATYNALASGIQWAVTTPGLEIGDTIAILGPGQRGLSSLLAARAAGARQVFVTGLSSDRHKLDAALELGASAVVDVDEEDAAARILELTGGEGVDVVVDVVPNAARTLLDAIAMVKPGGTIVLAGMKNGNEVQGLCTDAIAMKSLTIRGVLSKSSDSYRRTIAILESGELPLERLATHTFPLHEAEAAIHTLRGGVAGAKAICVSLAPNGP